MRSFLYLLILIGQVLPLSAAESLRILMIGNSYTAQTKAEVKGFLDADKKLEVELVAHCPGGRKLIEHLSSPKVDALLQDKDGWDVVVLQEQSQLPAFAMTSGGASLESFAKGGEGLLDKVTRLQPKARVLLFETWARHPAPDKFGTLKSFGGDPLKMQAALTKGYAFLRKNADKWDFSQSVEIVPVGRAWQAWYQQKGYKDDSVKLHSGDSSHPGPLGAYLTGAVFYQALTGRSPVELPFVGKVKDEGLAEALRKQAHEAF